MGTGKSKLTPSVIHLANSTLDLGSYDARIVLLNNGVNDHDLLF